jgi:hypothetical protein
MLLHNGTQQYSQQQYGYIIFKPTVQIWHHENSVCFQHWFALKIIIFEDQKIP